MAIEENWLIPDEERSWGLRTRVCAGGEWGPRPWTDPETQAAESEALPWACGLRGGRDTQKAGNPHRGPASEQGRSRESTQADASGVSPREQREEEGQASVR